MRLAFALLAAVLAAACAGPAPGPADAPHVRALRACDDGGDGGVLIDGVCL